MKTVIICMSTFLVFHIAMSQNPIDKGFLLLESGDFGKALEFFDSYLKLEPQNKTAQICYGRSLGLNGSPDNAVAYFADMKKRFPNDLEVNINYAESMLWANRFSDARSEYRILLKSNPQDFGLILGYANCLSNLREYDQAFEWVNKALTVKPSHPAALISRKFIRLGWAHELIGRQEYGPGKELLLQNLEEFPKDQESLLNLAQVYLATQQTERARKCYTDLASTKKDSITALIGISLVSHMERKDKDALTQAKMARAKAIQIEDTLLLHKAEERYVQALLWNQQYGSARKHIEILAELYKVEPWILGLQASLGMYSGKTKVSLDTYEQLLRQDSTSFDGNLGKANALFAEDRMEEAYRAAYKTLEIFENQKDAMALLEKLNRVHAPTFAQNTLFSSDSGQNVAWTSLSTVQLPWSTKTQASLGYQFRDTRNLVDQNQAQSHSVVLGLAYKWFPKTKTSLQFGLDHVKSSTGTYTQPLVDLRVALKPVPLQHFEFMYKRELENFNANLIQQQIVKNHLGLSFHQASNFNLGLYSQFIQSFQSDENKRVLLFSSIFYKLLQNPGVKIGFNYQYLGFSEQKPEIYFSPEQFQAIEFFSNSQVSFSKKSGMQLTGAAGLQQVEKETPTFTFRMDLSYNYQLNKKWLLGIYGKYSNVASATTAGFEITQVGVKFQRVWLNKQLFSKPKAR